MHRLPERLAPLSRRQRGTVLAIILTLPAAAPADGAQTAVDTEDRFEIDSLTFVGIEQVDEDFDPETFEWTRPTGMLTIG
jgi:hypothetical protein